MGTVVIRGGGKTPYRRKQEKRWRQIAEAYDAGITAGDAPTVVVSRVMREFSISAPSTVYSAVKRMGVKLASER